jgi:hypothetical protein
MRVLTVAITMVAALHGYAFADQATDETPKEAVETKVGVADIRDAAMKTVDINVEAITSSSVSRVMEGSFYQTFIERDNGDTFAISQVHEKDGVIRSFNLPEETKKVDDVLSFIKPDYVMIENAEARLLLSALRMVYDIDSVFPMYVNRFRDQWVLVVDNHEDSDSFIGFTAKIDGEGIIQTLVYSDEITISDAQVLDVDKLNKFQDDK